MTYNRSISQGNPLVPPAILNLLIANAMFYFLQLQFPVLIKWAALFPISPPPLWLEHYPEEANHFYPWQLITYGFLHDTRGLAHIIFNMLALWMFGREIELEWGTRRFLTFFLLCILGAGIANLTVMTLEGGPAWTVGASGGVFGVLLAFGMRYPNREIMLLFPPIPMKAKTLVILYGAMELFLGLGQFQAGVAHFAHLGGLLTGWILIQFWRGKLPIKPKDPLIF